SSKTQVPLEPEALVKHLNINIKRLSSAELLHIANSITDKGMQLTAYLIVQNELVERKEYELAQAINLNGMNVAHMSYKANLNSLYILLGQKNYELLLTNLEATKLNTEDLAFKYYLKAIAQISKGDTASAHKSIDQMLEALPLYTEAILLAIDYYEKRGNIDKAYEISANALTINHHNTAVKIKLCLLSVPKGLAPFVDKQLEELKYELSAQDYTAFKAKYDAEVSAQDAKFKW
ncbi:MAG TPA: hypothetical protein VL947_10015, partial [Cytophagales bacterium]|nr:hypothetical protein [Cytophagales bacterium]